MMTLSRPLRSMASLFKAAAIGEPCKMVLIVRKDLNMGVGKIAAQCSHAAVGAVDKVRGGPAHDDSTSAEARSNIEQHMNWLDAWFVTGSAKVVVQAPNAETLESLEKSAAAAGLPVFSVVDAGRTQVAAATTTVLSVGPGPRSKVDKVTGHLKLL